MIEKMWDNFIKTAEDPVKRSYEIKRSAQMAVLSFVVAILFYCMPSVLSSILLREIRFITPDIFMVAILFFNGFGYSLNVGLLKIYASLRK